MPKIIIKNPSYTGGDRRIRLVKLPTSTVTITELVGAMYEDAEEIRICLSPLKGLSFDCTSYFSDSGYVVAGGTFKVIVDDVPLTTDFVSLEEIKTILAAQNIEMLISEVDDVVTPTPYTVNADIVTMYNSETYGYDTFTGLYFTTAFPDTTVTVDWGDGVVEEYTVGQRRNDLAFDWQDQPYKHIYTDGLTSHTVTVRNDKPLYRLGVVGTTEVLDWGTDIKYGIEAGSGEVLVEVPDHLPTYVNDMSGMFQYCDQFNSANIVGWDVSRVKDMSNCFRNCSIFNQPLNGWNMSGVGSISGMFQNCYAFNQPLDQWDTSNVRLLMWTFNYAEAFNQDISMWDVSKVTNAEAFLRNAYAFNQDLSGWNMPSVQYYPNGFYDNSAVDNLSGYDYAYMPHWGSDRTNGFEAFVGAGTLVMTMQDGEVAHLENGVTYTHSGATAEVTHTFTGEFMFRAELNVYADRRKIAGTALISVISWPLVAFATGVYFTDSTNLIDTPYSIPSYFTTTKEMFKGCTAFVGEQLSWWWPGNITDMSSMFEGATSFAAYLYRWRVDKVTLFTAMFKNATSFSGSLNKWCVTNTVSEPSEMFLNCPISAGSKPVWGTCPWGY